VIQDHAVSTDRSTTHQVLWKPGTDQVADTTRTRPHDLLVTAPHYAEPGAQRLMDLVESTQ